MEAYPKRKTLRLQDFDYTGNYGCFITICVHNRLHLFGEVEENAVGACLRAHPHRPDEMAAAWLKELEHKFPGTKCTDYIVMPDHIHFVLLRQEINADVPLPQMIQWYKTQTTNAYIRGVKAGIYEPFSGRLWQRSYYEHMIRNEQDLTDILAYMQENPARWLEKRADT